MAGGARPTFMLKVHEKLEWHAEHAASLTLPFEHRQKSRLRARLDDGREVALALPRGSVLRHGDLLRAESGVVIEVRAAPEEVSTAFARDPVQLARACYHLGNRHVALQIGVTWVRYLHDHVLDDLVAALGLAVYLEITPFEPEAGVYQGHAHSREHGHAHEPDTG